MNVKKHNAFSLTELSISVVIISILIAAISTGISLQKQAQTRTIIFEINLIQSAITSFKLQYNYLPGDIPNATTLWPNATTVNGNGDNRISSDIYNSGSGDTKTEDTYVFQHLYLGGILPMIFTGGVQSTRYVLTNNSVGNVYPSKLNNAGYAIFYQTYYSNPWSNVIESGFISASGHTNGLFLSGFDAYQLDLKIDDGVPNTGKIITTGSCISSSPYSYLFINTAKSCKFSWILD